MTARDGNNAAVRITRRTARVTGVIMASFLLLMFLGYVLEGRGPSPDTLAPSAATGLALMAIYIAAMFMAVKQEFGGALLGAIALGSFFVILFLGWLPGNVSGGFSTRGVLNPVFLALWLPIALYAVCWRLEKRGER